MARHVSGVTRNASKIARHVSRVNRHTSKVVIYCHLTNHKWVQSCNLHYACDSLLQCCKVCCMPFTSCTMPAITVSHSVAVCRTLSQVASSVSLQLWCCKVCHKMPVSHCCKVAWSVVHCCKLCALFSYSQGTLFTESGFYRFHCQGTIKVSLFQYFVPQTLAVRGLRTQRWEWARPKSGNIEVGSYPHWVQPYIHGRGCTYSSPHSR
jgi:hypothetical protein